MRSSHQRRPSDAARGACARRRSSIGPGRRCPRRRARRSCRPSTRRCRRLARREGSRRGGAWRSRAGRRLPRGGAPRSCSARSRSKTFARHALEMRVEQAAHGRALGRGQVVAADRRRPLTAAPPRRGGARLSSRDTACGAVSPVHEVQHARILAGAEPPRGATARQGMALGETDDHVGVPAARGPRRGRSRAAPGRPPGRPRPPPRGER